MEQKLKIYYLVIIALLTSSMIFTSCDKEDEEDRTPPTPLTSLEDTYWHHDSIKVVRGNLYKISTTFRANGYIEFKNGKALHIQGNDTIRRENYILDLANKELIFSLWYTDAYTILELNSKKMALYNKDSTGEYYNYYTRRLSKQQK